MIELPCHKEYFTNASARITLPGFGNQPRWFDPWALKEPSELELWEARAQQERDAAYRKYLNAFDKGGRQMKWQVVRVHNRNHAHITTSDWWQDYRDCVFRVWMQPTTTYSNYVRDHVQHYILCPDDTYLTHCFERHRKGLSYPPRSSFKWISPHKDLRRMRVIPVEVCKHFRHETEGGKLPDEDEFQEKSLDEARV